MANMKELVVEIVAQVLVRKYGPLDDVTANTLLHNFEAAEFVAAGDIREKAQTAASGPS